MNRSNSEQTYSTKTDQAYWTLRKAIVTGEFDEWAPLDESDLMASIDVGRTPIREAIKRLATEEFVVWHPHRTPHVRTTSADDLAALYEARQIFETTAAVLAAERATLPELEQMERICDQLDEARELNKLYEIAELDYDYHLAIARASHNRFLVEAISHLNLGSLRLWYRSYILMGIERINDHHRQQLEAIRNRNAELVESITMDHIEFSHERQLRIFGLPNSSGAANIGNSPMQANSPTKSARPEKKKKQATSTKPRRRTSKKTLSRV